MSEYGFLNGVGILTMIIAVIFSFFRFSRMDMGGRMILLLLIVALVTEVVAVWTGIYFGNNIAVYSIFNIVEVCIVSLFYNESIAMFKRHNIGLHIAIAGIILGILNLSLFQSVTTSNSNFMVGGGIYIIGTSTYAIIRIVLDDEERNPLHFWLNMVLLFYWSVSLVTWCLYDDMVHLLGVADRRLTLAIHMINWLTNLFFAFIFFFTPKKEPSWTNHP